MSSKKIEEMTLEEPCTSNGGQTASIQLFENDANICNPIFYSDINEEEVKQLQAEHFKLAKIFRTYREHPTFLKEFDKKRTTKYETLRKMLHTRTTKLNRYRRKIKHFELLAREMLRTTLEGNKLVHFLEIADVTPVGTNPEIQESISDYENTDSSATDNKIKL